MVGGWGVSSFRHVKETQFFSPHAQKSFSFLKQSTSGNSGCNLFLTLFLNTITPLWYCLCAVHFIEDSFHNMREFSADFAEKLLLKHGAVLT